MQSGCKRFIYNWELSSGPAWGIQLLFPPFANLHIITAKANAHLLQKECEPINLFWSAPSHSHKSRLSLAICKPKCSIEALVIIKSLLHGMPKDETLVLFSGNRYLQNLGKEVVWPVKRKVGFDILSCVLFHSKICLSFFHYGLR